MPATTFSTDTLPWAQQQQKLPLLARLRNLSVDTAQSLLISAQLMGNDISNKAEEDRENQITTFCVMKITI